MAMNADPYRTLGLARGRAARRGEARLSAAGQGQPPRCGGRGGTAPVPGHPGGVRPDRRAGLGGPGDRTGTDRAFTVGDRPVTGRGDGAGLRRANTTNAAGAGRATGEWRPAAATAARGRGDGPAPPPGTAAEQGHARVHVLRRRRCRAVRARLGRRVVVRDHVGDVLDAQSQGIRGSAQARAGVPGPGPAPSTGGGTGARGGAAHRRRGRGRGRGDARGARDRGTRGRCAPDTPAGVPATDPHHCVVVGSHRRRRPGRGPP